MEVSVVSQGPPTPTRKTYWVRPCLNHISSSFLWNMTVFHFLHPCTFSLRSASIISLLDWYKALFQAGNLFWRKFSRICPHFFMLEKVSQLHLSQFWNNEPYSSYTFWSLKQYLWGWICRSVYDVHCNF